jgi:hypothetical protein
MKPTSQCGTHSVAWAGSPRRYSTFAGGPINFPQIVGCVVDLDPTHRVLRITLTTVLTDELGWEVYRTVARLASRGGPYAAIGDLSQVVAFPISTDTVRHLAAMPPAVPAGRRQVIVAPQPALYGLARMFELHLDSMGGRLHVVHSIGEAYEVIKVAPQDFSQRLFPVDVAA